MIRRHNARPRRIGHWSPIKTSIANELFPLTLNKSSSFHGENATVNYITLPRYIAFSRSRLFLTLATIPLLSLQVGKRKSDMRKKRERAKLACHMPPQSKCCVCRPASVSQSVSQSASQPVWLSKRLKWNISVVRCGGRGRRLKSSFPCKGRCEDGGSDDEYYERRASGAGRNQFR